jgi:hypothetical protein
VRKLFQKTMIIMTLILMLVLLVSTALPVYASVGTAIKGYAASLGISILAPYAIALVALVLVWMISCAAKALISLAKKITDETLRASLISAISEAQTVAQDAVAYVKQTYTDAIKAAACDGKLTALEKEKALEKAKDAFISSISEKSLMILKEQFSNYMDYIVTLIEAKLGLSKLKNSTASS